MPAADGCANGSSATATRATRRSIPVDWVERIPFGETRNYVQRVMENVQCYRARFGGSAALTVEAALRGNRAVQGARSNAATKAAAAESDPRDGEGTHSGSSDAVD